MNEWQDRIRKLFKQLNKEYLTASEMRGHFELDRSDRQNFKHLLRSLVDEGFIRFDARKRIYLTEVQTTPKAAPKPSKQEQGEKYKLKRGTLFLKQNRWWVQELGSNPERYPLTGVRPGLKEGQNVQFRLQKGEGRFSELAKLASGQTFERFRQLADFFLKKQSLPPFYPNSPLADLDQRKSPAEEGYEGRLDLRHLPVLCIDPLGARDHDDAISFAKKPDGSWELGVHIADVSHYVLENTALDSEARRRSYTQYLPWEALPMLPEQLSSGWCSLVENEDRFALSCLIDLDPLGAVRSFRFAKTVVKVTRSITYEEAQSFKESGDAQLVAYAEMCEALRSQRLKTGVLLLDMPESRVAFDEEGDPVKIESKKSLPSMNWIEECMLIANQCCAKFCVKNKLNGVFRTHEPPQKMDIQELAFNEPDLFKSHPTVREIIDSPDAEGHGMNVDPARFKLYMALVESARGDTLMMRKILRSMSKARYSATPDGHFALNWADYSHFTSPIRRYADLWVHREITKKLAGQKIKVQLDETDEMCEEISEREIINMKNERSAVKLCAAWIMKDQLGETFDGVISGIESFGMFVEIPSTGAEGLLRYQDLGDDYYEYIPEKDVVVGKRTRKVYKRGDKLKVILSKVNLEDAQLDFVLAKSEDEMSLPTSKELSVFNRRPMDRRVRFSPRSENSDRTDRSDRSERSNRSDRSERGGSRSSNYSEGRSPSRFENRSENREDQAPVKRREFDDSGRQKRGSQGGDFDFDLSQMEELPRRRVEVREGSRPSRHPSRSEGAADRPARKEGSGYGAKKSSGKSSAPSKRNSSSAPKKAGGPSGRKMKSKKR